MNSRTQTAPALLLCLAALLAAAGCGSDLKPDAPGVDGSTLFPIVVQLDWVAEPEHGAFYTAEALGYFTAEGLDVTLHQGGANANVLEKVATNRANFGQWDSTNSMVAIQEGLPIINIAAVFQHDPSVLMLHESNPVEGFADLDGQLIKARPEWAFLPFLRRTYGIDFRIVPHDFGLELLVADKTMIQQGYFIAEPYHASKQGARLRWLHVWDAGYDNCNTLIANRAFITEHPQQTRAFLRAYYRGYREYMEGDPQPAHRLMQEVNDQVTPAFLSWSRLMIREQKLDRGDPARGGPGEYLVLTSQRMQDQITMLEQLDILEPGKLTASDVMTDEFLPWKLMDPVTASTDEEADNDAGAGE